MTDKSFGDHTDRSIVKNPLLSTAVVGLSIEDLTHNAVLLPVAQNPGLISSQEIKQVKNADTIDQLNLPSGDAKVTTHTPAPINETNPHIPKADDFDVSEYFARLQGTRYVSAPPNSTLDQNSNLPAEESLEEISLNDNEEQKVQQSLSSDIAQNFSQLPQVLPQVASAVFSSFSNILSLRSREQTSEVVKAQETGYQEQEVRSPGETQTSVTMMMSGEKKDAPLKEPPIGNATNTFRISTKKKAYAQIPGLSSIDYQQNPMAPTNINPPPPSLSNPPPYFVPNYQPQINKKQLPPIGVPIIPKKSTANSINQNLGVSDVSRAPTSAFKSVDISSSSYQQDKNKDHQQFSYTPLTMPNQNLHGSLYSKSDSFVGHDNIEKWPINRSAEIGSPDVQELVSTGNTISSNTSMSGGVSIFTPSALSQDTDLVVSQHSSDILNLPLSSSSRIPNASPSVPSAAIIPPPTMFSNETKKDQVKTLLPPSIARRLSGNQPIMKPQNPMPAPPVSFFVPTPVADHSSSSHMQSVLPLQSSYSVAANVDHQTVFTNPAAVVELTKAMSSTDGNKGNMPSTAHLQCSDIMTFNEAITAPPPMFFNPASITMPESISIPPGFLPPASSNFPQSTIGPPKQLFDPATITNNIPQPPTAAPEPPKIVSGNINFRLAKKRPQYYSGPIEGVGAISNNVKPVIAPIDTTNTFKGAVFTPQSITQQEPANPSQIPPFVSSQEAATTFNISQTFEDNGRSDRQYNYIQGRHETQPQQDYNTVFDLSRKTNEEFEQTKQESQGFGIIGSLKSKLTSLDINKIQNSVTTFFDPSYNSVATETTNHQEIQTHSQSEYPNNETSNTARYGNLEIFIPRYENTQKHQESTYKEATQNQQDIAYDTTKYNPQNYYQNPDPNVQNYDLNHGECYSDPKQTASGQEGTQESFSNNLLGIYENPPYQLQENLPAHQFFENQQPNNIETHNSDSNQKNLNSFSEMQKEMKPDVENKVNSDSYLNSSEVSENASFLFGDNTTDSQVHSYQYFGDIYAPVSSGNDREISDLQDKISNASLHEQLNPHTSSTNLFSRDDGSSYINDTFRVSEAEDVTTQLIENITSPIQLSNPVEVPFTESDSPKISIDFETNQCKEITHVAEETIEFIQIKTATDFLEKRDSDLFENNYTEHSDIKYYGWRDNQVPEADATVDHDYTFHTDPNAVGFCSGNSLFFDNIPNNASDEIKAEFKNVIDDSPAVILDRQMSIPTAPPVEDLDDTKSDGTCGLDVHLIEQDAKSDFADFEEFVIEPSETDDDKIEVKERERTSEDPIEVVDSFTNRVEKFKHLGDSIDVVAEQRPMFDIPTSISPAYPIASYFDTGNYAADTHYRNSLSSPTSLNLFNVGQHNPTIFALVNPRAEGILDVAKQEANIPQSIDISHIVPPGFSVDIPIPYIPDTTTQTAVTSTITQSTIKQIAEEIAIGAVLPDVDIYNLIQKPEREMTRKLSGFTSVFNKPIMTECEQEKSSDIVVTKTAFINQDSSLSSLFFDKEAPFSPKCAPIEKPALSNLSNKLFEDKSSDTQIPSQLVSSPFANISSTSFEHMPTDVLRFAPISRPDSSNSSTTLIGKKSSDTSNSTLEKQPLSSNFTTNSQTFFTQTPPQIPVSHPSLPDPMNFFSSSVAAEDTKKSDPETGFNRLASYFTPSSKTDTTKSFFELSQGQDHLRKEHPTPITSEQYTANVKLMNDLTSTEFYQPTQDQVVKTVNYFMVEYDNMCLSKPLACDLKTSKFTGDNVITVDDSIESKEPLKALDVPFKNGVFNIIDKCKYCCNLIYTCDDIVDITKQDINSRSAMDSHAESKGYSDTASTKSEEPGKAGNVSFNLTVEDNNEDSVIVLPDNRIQSEYIPVKHHWFYRVDQEGKSTWKGFSDADSNSLEAAFHSPDLNDDTVVATDGGRYDVNVKGRLRLAVYWTDKPTNVRRCSWFYKGTTDARYVPYTESVAEKLEEEYRHGVTTGEWHRRLVLPNNEVVVMHGAAVMVHFLQSGSNDAWSAPSHYFFNKKTVYRNPPKIRMAKDQVQKIDHLLMFVHGAGEWRNQREKLQATMRPRVVRRGCDESEIEDQEPTKIDHLLLLCHGVGSTCDMRFRSVEEVVDDFRATSLQLIQGHYKNSYDNGVVGRIEVLPISWHATLHSGERGVDRRLSRISLQSIPLLRGFTNDTVLDVLFYTSPAFCQTIIETVCQELNRIYSLFKSRNPEFQGGVSLGGHSLGSVILYDLLCHQAEKAPTKVFINDAASTGMPNIKYPRLEFTPACLYALGSPIAMFECIRGVELLGEDFKLPTCCNFFNIFHPYDPIAYRVEPLINPQLKGVAPFLIPHHKGRKRMHLELKETVARVGADIKQRLIESIKTTWSSMWRTQPPSNEQLEKVVEEEIEKEVLQEEDTDISPPDVDVDAQKLVGKLNAGRRIDYVLQEAPFEMINEYLFAMSSHVCYWESEDTMLLILREIYESLGVQPDSTLPQQTMTVQRTRVTTQKDESTCYVSTDEAGSSK